MNNKKHTQKMISGDIIYYQQTHIVESRTHKGPRNLFEMKFGDGEML